MESDIDFGVEKLPVFVEQKQVPAKIAIVRSDTRKVLSIAGSRYRIVDHRKIIEDIDTILNENRYAFERGDVVCKDGARVYSCYQFAGIEFNIGDSDRVTLTLILKNSYDSGCKVGFNLGGHRICSHATLAVNKELVSFSKSHTTNFKDKDFVEKISSVIDDYANQVVPFWNKLYDNKITTIEGLDLVDKICATKIFPNRYKEDVLLKWSNPILEEDEPRNMWVLYNAFVSYIHQNLQNKKWERAEGLKQDLDQYFYGLV